MAVVQEPVSSHTLTPSAAMGEWIPVSSDASGDLFILTEGTGTGSAPWARAVHVGLDNTITSGDPVRLTPSPYPVAPTDFLYTSFDTGLSNFIPYGLGFLAYATWSMNPERVSGSGAPILAELYVGPILLNGLTLSVGVPQDIDPINQTAQYPLVLLTDRYLVVPPTDIVINDRTSRIVDLYLSTVAATFNVGYSYHRCRVDDTRWLGVMDSGGTPHYAVLSWDGVAFSEALSSTRQYYGEPSYISSFVRDTPDGNFVAFTTPGLQFFRPPFDPGYHHLAISGDTITEPHTGLWPDRQLGGQMPQSMVARPDPAISFGPFWFANPDFDAHEAIYASPTKDYSTTYAVGFTADTGRPLVRRFGPDDLTFLRGAPWYPPDTESVPNYPSTISGFGETLRPSVFVRLSGNRVLLPMVSDSGDYKLHILAPGPVDDTWGRFIVPASGSYTLTLVAHPGGTSVGATSVSDPQPWGHSGPLPPFASGQPLPITHALNAGDEIILRWASSPFGYNDELDSGRLDSPTQFTWSHYNQNQAYPAVHPFSVTVLLTLTSIPWLRWKQRDDVERVYFPSGTRGGIPTSGQKSQRQGLHGTYW